MRGKAAAFHAGTHHHAVKFVHFFFSAVVHGDLGLVAVAVQRHHVLLVQAFHTQARNGCGQAKGEFVDVARGVALGEIATVIVAGQRGLNRFHLCGRHRPAWQATFGQQLGDFARVVKAFFVAVDVQDAFFFQVKVHALGLRPGKQVLACGHGQACRLNGVAAVVGHVAYELGKPAELVPAGLRVDQERRVALEHPLDALEDGGPVVPDLGIRRRQLSAVGKRCFHCGVTVFLEQGDGKAALGQCVSGSNTRDAATNDCD